MIYALAYFLTLVFLAYLYELPFSRGYPSWLSAAIVNSCLAAICLPFVRKNIRWKLSGNSRTYFYLTLLFLVSVFTLGWYFGGFHPHRRIDVIKIGASILWIPVIEEIVFRAVFGSFICSTMGLGVGVYVSALGFSLIHTWPTFARIVSLNIGLPLGPFFLGLICQWLYHKTKNLMVPIFFHAACNSTVLIFYWTDGSLLHRLKWLYT